VKIDKTDVFELIRSRIRSRGARGIAGLGRSFKVIDDNSSGKLNHEEFFKALKDYRISSDPREYQAIFDEMDINNDGEISYEEFLRAIVGEMNPFRKALTKRAFAKMDLNGNGYIELSDIKQRYNAKKHPEVLMGRK